MQTLTFDTAGEYATCSHCGVIGACSPDRPWLAHHEPWCIYKPTLVLDHGYVAYKAHLGDDLTPLEAARMSTGNATGVDEAKDAATRDYLWRHGHQTPFEMAVLQVEIQCPIFVAREVFRQRMASFNEYSGRYAKMLDLYYHPDDSRLLTQNSVNKQGSSVTLLPRHIRDEIRHRMAEETRLVRDNYEFYIEAGLAREVARIDLPLSQYTRFRMQMNLRGWFTLLNMRLRPDTLWEYRQFAQEVARIIAQLYPETWKVFKENTLDGVHLTGKEIRLLRKWFDQVLIPPMTKDLLEAGFTDSQGREFLDKLGIVHAIR